MHARDAVARSTLSDMHVCKQLAEHQFGCPHSSHIFKPEKPLCLTAMPLMHVQHTGRFDTPQCANECHLRHTWAMNLKFSPCMCSARSCPCSCALWRATCSPSTAWPSWLCCC